MVGVIGFRGFDFVRLFSLRGGRKVTFFVFVLVVFAFGAVIYAYANVYFFSVSIQSRGVVKSLGVGVYWDEACSRPVSSLDWGVVEPGAQKNFTFYVRNEGNMPGRLSLSAVNWSPQIASSYMTLTWDYKGQVLEPYKSVKVTLKLLISQEIQGITNFNFDTIISIG
jgi:hypothetical protein